MKTAYIKYIVALLLFGSNGVMAAFIALNSYAEFMQLSMSKRGRSALFGRPYAGFTVNRM